MSLFLLINRGDRRHCSSAVLKSCSQLLERQGAKFHIAESTSVEHSQRLINEAHHWGFETLVIGGGDGTINVVLNQAKALPFKFAILPLGTSNSIAKGLGYPLPPLKALAAILNGTTQRIPLGEVNGCMFLGFASIGFDAKVVHKVRLGSYLRTLSHILEGIRMLPQAKRLAEIEVALPEREPLKGCHLILVNEPYYGGIKFFDALAHADSMQLFVFKGKDPGEIVRYLLGFFPRRQKLPSPLPDVEALEIASGFEVHSEERMYLQLDGEPISLGDDRHYQFKIHPRALEFILPNSCE
jgi:diacylglycerol kinase family enzyme